MSKRKHHHKASLQRERKVPLIIKSETLVHPIGILSAETFAEQTFTSYSLVK